MDTKVDVARALQLRLEKGLTYRELGQIFNVCPQAVHKALQPFRKLIEQPEAVAAYRKTESAILDAVRMTLVSNMVDPERLSKASVNNLAFAFRQLFDANRLLRNESTANLGLRAATIVAAHRR